MSEPWIAAVFSLFCWWFFTGASLFAVRHADRHGWQARLRITVWSLPLLLLGFAGFWATLTEETLLGVYVAFLAALAIWGWIELAFLTGLIAGPNRTPCPEDATGWDRFRRAWGTIAYHELLLVTALLAIWLLSYEAANQITLLTFAVLFVARVSAKLNLFFGVPKINTEFLPGPMLHLPSHMRIRRLNWVFPGSVTVLTLALGYWANLLAITGNVQFAFLSAITALALLEHWLMILPLPDEKLWRWMIPAATKTNKGAPAPPPSGEYHGL